MYKRQLFLLIILMMPVSLYAQYRVSSAYNKNAQIPSRGGITGREAAAAVMALSLIHICRRRPGATTPPCSATASWRCLN